MTQKFSDTMYEYGANSTYIAEIYEQYLINPNSVDASWKQYFDSLGDNPAQVASDFGGPSWAKDRTRVLGCKTEDEIAAEKAAAEKAKKAGKAPAASAAPADRQASEDSIRAHMLIRAFRVRGHLLAKLDPLDLDVRESHPELDPARYGFCTDAWDREIFIGGWLGLERTTLRELMNLLHETYCSHIGTEFIHIQSLERKEWLEHRLESSRAKPKLSADEKKIVLNKLIEVVGFEEFLHKKFPGMKRFSAEGGENLLTSMEAAVTTAAQLGVKEVVLGMPHRGRLNVLTAFMGKPYVAMLSEFQGNLATPDWINSSGDVKYHLGFSSDKKFGGREVHLSLTANPSHLEAVNPVVTGKVRAKQDQFNDTRRESVMGILLHGDAAFCGQGVVAETLALNDLEGYKTGGTIHIVVNNQIGFTTTPKEQHTSPYPTDVAMMIQAPIFHVNGDDPEAVVHVSRIAAEFRQRFQKDVVIDIWCYRKHGHNEGDEPRWTQPKMYRKVDEKETPRDIYAKQLIAEGVITDADFENLKQEFYNRLDKAFAGANDYKPEKADMLEGKWEGITLVDEGEKPKIETGVNLEKLKKVGNILSTQPDGMKLHRGVERVLGSRAKMIETGENLDWAMGEALAFGTLLTEGFPIRLSGQDVIRGTFSQRHSGVWDQESEQLHFPLNNLEEGQATYEAINSNLSEFAVLGYEYGYSSAEPNTLTIWEGQFGDFANGAQTIFDQFISSAEVKWLRMSGLVMLLPHGYEGQGPEHSSARIERYLQQCAEDNLIVANCTTPANYFHILRRQLTRDFRKPLVLFTPKSLLRHKRAQSSLSELAEGSTFRRVLPDIDPRIEANSKARKLVICSGKVYYDLLEAREAKKLDDVVIIRLEQYYPFPHSSLLEEVKKYPDAEVVWCQEEPENMGAWTFVDRRIEAVLLEAGGAAKRPAYVGRKAAAATACGYMRIHTREQQELIEGALS